MFNTLIEKPLYQKLGLNLFSIIALGFILFIGKEILIPFLFSILIASLLLPSVFLFKRKGLGKTTSILIPVALSFILICFTFYFFSSQLSNFLQDYGTLKLRVDELIYGVKKWVNVKMHITFRKQNQYLNETVEKLKGEGPKLIGVTFNSLINFAIYLILIPIYSFLLLYYRSSIHRFLTSIFKNGSEEKIKEVLNASALITRQYIIGLLIEALLVFALNAIGFLILGIKYAIFLSILVAILNLVPYVGMIVANLICMIVTLVSSNSITDVVWVGVILAIVQIVDNNLGMPLIVGSKIKINALAIILGVLVGGALCGIAGMFLAIPGLAVLKVIFDNVPSLQPWSILLSDQPPQSNN